VNPLTLSPPAKATPFRIMPWRSSARFEHRIARPRTRDLRWRIFSRRPQGRAGLRPCWRGYTVRSTRPSFSRERRTWTSTFFECRESAAPTRWRGARRPRGGPVRLCSNSTPSANPSIGQEWLEVRVLDKLSSPVLVHHHARHQARGLAHHVEGRFCADRGPGDMRRRCEGTPRFSSAVLFSLPFHKRAGAYRADGLQPALLFELLRALPIVLLGVGENPL
jgi:hypothetical protein